MNNRTNPLISVIVPVYNVAPYVEACLNSIVCQFYKNIEILVVDDASTDGSYDICKKFAVADKRIQLIQHSENSGISAARNTALKIAKGDYISFIDSDDTIEKDMYTTMCSAAQKTGVDIVVCGYHCMDENGKNNATLFSIRNVYSSARNRKNKI